MCGPFKTVERLSDQESAEVLAARAAARRRFAKFVDRGVTSVEFGADNPPMTDANLARLRPAAEVVSALVAARLRRNGRPYQSTQPAAEPSTDAFVSDVV